MGKNMIFWNRRISRWLLMSTTSSTKDFKVETLYQKLTLAWLTSTNGPDLTLSTSLFAEWIFKTYTSSTWSSLRSKCNSLQMFDKNRQAAKLPSCQIAKLPNCQAAKLPKYQSAKGPNCQGAKLPRGQIAEGPNCQGAKLLRSQIAKGPIVKEPNSKVPNCQIAKLPNCQILILFTSTVERFARCIFFSWICFLALPGTAADVWKCF